jgi:hypothetical protein
MRQTVINTAVWGGDSLCPPGAGKAASYGYTIPDGYVQAIEALACVNKIMTLDKKLLFFQPVYCIPDSP